MKFIKLIILIGFSICLTNVATAFAQPCGPKKRLVDKQYVTHSGDILLFKTDLESGLMVDFDNDITFNLNYVLITQNGQIKKDTTLRVNWVARYHDYMAYNDNSNKSDDPYTKYKLYVPFSQNDIAIIDCFSAGDRKFVYTKYNNANKDGKWTLYNLDTIGNPIVSNYHSELTKYMFFKNYLEDKDSRTIAITPVPVEQFEFLNKKKKIKIKNRHLELNEISLDKKWTLSGKKWSITLDGLIFNFYNNQPLFSIKDNIAYITVFNEDICSCRGYGQDIFPIIYAIDIKKGKVKWKQKINY